MDLHDFGKVFLEVLSLNLLIQFQSQWKIIYVPHGKWQTMLYQLDPQHLIMYWLLARLTLHLFVPQPILQHQVHLSFIKASVILNMDYYLSMDETLLMIFDNLWIKFLFELYPLLNLFCAQFNFFKLNILYREIITVIWNSF